jgi:hypothetical protein
MQAKILDPVDTTYLDRVFLDSRGEYRVPPCAELLRENHDHIQAWCHHNARYNLPTQELVEFVKGIIGSRSAIEIGSGMGDFGRALGIPMTDSYQQTMPEVRLYYAMIGQPIISPPPKVERLNAMEAIKKYKPQVVVASWVTQLYQNGDTPKNIGSNIHGIDEMWLLDNVETYIHVGNERVHKDKRILAREHRELHLPFVVSRAFDQDKNVVWIWDTSRRTP